jgi:hypothetical protein
MNDSAAIIVMCKAPVAGTVKTRLVPFLSAEQAAAFAACLAHDSVGKAKKICKNIVVAFSGEKFLLEHILPGSLIWIEQRGADLGERMNDALEFARSKQFSPLVVIGTDSPTLPMEFVAEAFEILRKNQDDVVLGESADGGYYLVGLREPNAEIFRNVEWSSPRTFAGTRRNIEQLNLRLKVLPLWFDVDTPADLLRLQKEFASDANNQEIAVATAIWLKENAALFLTANEPTQENIE